MKTNNSKIYHLPKQYVYRFDALNGVIERLKELATDKTIKGIRITRKGGTWSMFITHFTNVEMTINETKNG